MNRKTIFALLVLLLALLAPATGEASASAEEIIGSMNADDYANIAGEDVRSWTLAASFVLALYGNDGFEGLVDASMEVVHVLEGSTAGKEIDELLPTRVMKIRYLVCAWVYLTVMEERASDVEQGKRSVARLGSYLEDNISGFRGHRAELAKVATLSILYAGERFRENGNR